MPGFGDFAMHDPISFLVSSGAHLQHKLPWCPASLQHALHSTALHPVRANTQTWPFQSLEVGANGEGQHVESLADARN